MKVYLVGGAVRDKLLGIEVNDRDYVIVGATQDDIKQLLADGYRQVGTSFPVFLHPETNEEYALARTERKTGVGYQGFETYSGADVSLEDDLMRRDLTINAMAMDLETGDIIDPYGGQADLAQGILRHVSSAFAEDPLRVLRVARFAAKLNFVPHDTTIQLMRNLVASGELATLSRERMWKELERGFNAPFPAAMFFTLHEARAITAYRPFAAMTDVQRRYHSFSLACSWNFSFNAKVLVAGLGYDKDEDGDWKLPAHLRDLLTTFTRHYDKMCAYGDKNASDRLAVLEVLGLIRPNSYLQDLVQAMQALLYGRLHSFNATLLESDINALQTLNMKEVVASVAGDRDKIAETVRNARISVLSKNKP